MAAGAGQVVELAEQADEPRARVELALLVAGARADLQELLGQLDARLGGVGAPGRQERLPEHERERLVGGALVLGAHPRAQIADDLRRVGDEPVAPVALRRPVQGAGQPRPQPRAQRVDADVAAGLVEHVDGLAQERDDVVLDHARRQAPRGVGERRLRHAHGIAEPAGGRGGAREGLAAAWDVTRAHARLAQRLEDVGVAGVVGAEDVAQVGRAVEEPRALGVVEARHGVVAGVQRVAQGLLRGHVRHRLEHVERELGEVLVGALAVALAQRTGDVGVQRAALAGREGGEQRLAHERVGEVEAARSGLAGDEPRAGGLVDRRERRAQLDVRRPPRACRAGTRRR